MQKYDLNIKYKHTVIEPWPLRVTKRTMKEEFEIRCASTHTGCERYMEFERYMRCLPDTFAVAQKLFRELLVVLSHRPADEAPRSPSHAMHRYTFSTLSSRHAHPDSPVCVQLLRTVPNDNA